ncbi:MAG: FIST N-terminal domain-containing protein [Euryarchaeota archaeon]|nr:FIST N-terminal domain-containing protein [Euryarchaeota archaeon]
MVTTLATGLCGGENDALAATDAVLRAKEELGSARIDLSIVYSTSECDYQEVVDAVREATGNAPLIGASTAGEFTEDGVNEKNVAVGLLSSDDIKVFTAISEGVKEDPEAAIKEVVAKLPGKVRGYPYLTAILIADGLSGVGERIALLASYLFGKGLRIVGGMAGDDFKMEKTFVFCDGNVRTDAIGVCLLASKMPLFTGVKHGHTPVSRELKATRTEGNVLYEINNMPAWAAWKEETAETARKAGIDVNQLKTPVEIAQFCANSQLGLATEREGEYKIRWPVSANEDGSLNFACDIAEGAIFRIMDGSNLEGQIDAAEGAIMMAKRSAEDAGYSEFAGILVFDCAHRQLMMGVRFSESVDRFKNVLPGVPLLGWETYGEIRLEPGQFSGFHNTTAVVLLLPKDSNAERR